MDSIIFWMFIQDGRAVFTMRESAHSPLSKQVTDGKLLPNNSIMVSGIEILLYFIGGAAYPLQTWLMKPFPRLSVLTDDKKRYNYSISKACLVVENAFGCLKARWRRLMKRNDMIVAHIPNVIAAAGILHNVCETHGEHFDEV